MGKGVQLTHDCIAHIGSYALPLGSFDNILIPSHVQVSDVSRYVFVLVMVCHEMLACLYRITVTSLIHVHTCSSLTHLCSSRSHNVYVVTLFFWQIY